MYEDQFTQSQAKQAFRYLKRGVCPDENINFFTVGLANELNSIRGALESIRSGAIKCKSYFLEALYGYGKSHLLKVIESIALEQGFAVTQVTNDGYDRAFNHPPRYIHHLYESLSVPGLSTRGLGDVVSHLLRGPQRNSLLHWANTPDVRRGIGYHIRQMANISDSADSFYHKYLINSRDIQRRSGTYYRHLLYERLKTLADLCRAIGLSGLVVLFDEVESIATLLGNVRSRLRSYEILGELTDSRAFPYCCFCFAVTPDFGDKIKNWDYQYEYDYYMKYYNDLYRDGCKFMEAWVENKPDLLQIQKISAADNRDLCQKLWRLHEHAYSWSANDRISSAFIESYIDEAERHALLQREIVKSFVDILEICQQNPSFNLANELKLEIIKPEVNETDIIENNPADFFFRLAQWAKERDLLQSWDLRLLNDIGRHISNQWPISNKKKQRTLQIMDTCTSAGFPGTTNQESIEELKENQRSIIIDVINTLTPREQLVIQLRYGLVNNTFLTLEEVGQQFNVTRERIRQIQKKALRKLRHPSRSRKLKDMLNSDLLDEGYNKLIVTIFGEE